MSGPSPAGFGSPLQELMRLASDSPYIAQGGRGIPSQADIANIMKYGSSTFYVLPAISTFLIFSEYARYPI